MTGGKKYRTCTTITTKVQEDTPGYTRKCSQLRTNHIVRSPRGVISITSALSRVAGPLNGRGACVHLPLD